MARPLRKLYVVERMARRRHRTWMMSMTLATLSMGVWAVTVLLMRFAPERAPSFTAAFCSASVFALPGFLLGLLTVRGRLAWLLFAAVPIMANVMQMFLPWVVHRLRNPVP